MSTDTEIIKLRKKILFSVILTTIILLISVAGGMRFLNTKKLQEASETFHKQAHMAIIHSIDYNKKTYDFMLRRIASDKQLMEHFKNKDRDALYNAFKTRWELYKQENDNIKILQFHNSDGTSFLRMHKPEQYGDEIYKTRPMIAKIHSEHKNLHGYEVGINETVYRFIRPIFDNKEYIGAVEIGIDHKMFTDEIYAITGSKTIFLENKAMAKKSENSLSYEYEKYIYANAKDKQIHQLLESIPYNYTFDECYSFSIKNDMYVAHVNKIKDYTDNIAGVIVNFQKIKNSSIFEVLLTLTGIFGFIFFVAILLYFWLSRELELFESNLQAIYERINKGLLRVKAIMKNAHKLANLGNWEYKIGEKKIRISDECLEICDFKESDLLKYEKNRRKEVSIDTFTAYMDQEDKQNFKEMIKQAITNNCNNGFEFSYKFYLDNDDVKYMKSRANCEYDENGNVTKIMGISLDITESKKLELELKEKDELMISQSRQAAMGDMIAMIAHQWRQPITVVAMAANNLKADIAFGEEIVPDKLNIICDDILKQTAHLSKTIDDFRNFFKPAKEKTKATINTILDNAMAIIGKSLQNNNIKVSINQTGSKEIFTYENELLQVFLNILNNAKDELKDNKGSYLNISISEVDDMVDISFCDNGGGIPQNILAHLGEPYVSSKVKSGTGLGIYMSKIIVEKHLNGRMSWQNTDVGACFTVSIPINFTEKITEEG